MKPTSHALTWIVLSSSATACPFGESSGNEPPYDAVHHQGLRRRLTNIDYRPVQRELQLVADCLTEDTYDAIYSDIEALSAAHADDVSRGHFLGGIVRLAAHDFMDHDISSDSMKMGADGCIDWQHEANSGLNTIWCDDGCPLTQIYQEKYSLMSRADFWVASANAVIKLRSPNNALDLKTTFKWGRVDADQCPDSALRLPGASDCGQVQDVFLNRLGLTWTDAVALIGAHTLGRGSSGFSGHDGIWVDTDSESTIFDKRYYEEVLRRAWVPRNEGTDVQDWTWGGGNNGSPRFMLNTDMCLLFDIQTAFPCCSRTDLTRTDGTNQCDTRNSFLSGTQCGRTTNEEAASAMLEFAAQRVDDPNRFTNDNVPFFTAFSVAWEIATTNGWDSLQELSLSCVPTGSPTQLPTAPPTPGPTQSPTASFSLSPTASCNDVDSFTDNNGRTRDCQWVITNQRCQPFSHLCPVSCGECDCLAQKSVCTSSEDCCSGSCVSGQCACLVKGESCSSNEQCCSDLCRDDGTCAGKQGAFETAA